MWNFGNLNHSVEPFSATLGTCKSGTFMWNLVEPQLLTVEPLFSTDLKRPGAVLGMLR